MPRPKSDNPKRHQILVRVTDDELGLIRAAVSLCRLASPSAYLRQLIEQNLAVLAADPAVRRHLQLFVAFDARHTGDVVPFVPPLRRSDT